MSYFLQILKYFLYLNSILTILVIVLIFIYLIIDDLIHKTF